MDDAVTPMIAGARRLRAARRRLKAEWESESELPHQVITSDTRTHNLCSRRARRRWPLLRCGHASLQALQGAAARGRHALLDLHLTNEPALTICAHLIVIGARKQASIRRIQSTVCERDGGRDSR